MVRYRPIVNYIAMSPGGNHFLGADNTAIPLKKQKELVKVKQEVRTNLLS
jgi:hypothetical protein